ncbi:MAG: phage tail sheath subtilisin-like domain-containing protein [Anaerolineae bacterium]|nr:phage tail sheath subtilisin-like domain-containing protein [Anaerolineae bacterium]
MAGPISAPGVYVIERPSGSAPIAGVGTSTAGFIGNVPDTIQIPSSNPNFDPTSAIVDPGNLPYVTTDFTLLADAGDVKLITNFGEFKKFFGNFAAGNRNLAHAVFGFFNNGGTRCYVARITEDTQIEGVLDKFEAIDEIALVAAPGMTDAGIRALITTHCQQKTQDRFAIFDSDETIEEAGNLDLTKLDPGTDGHLLPANTNYGAFYFPWLQVFDPATKIMDPSGNGRIFVPPSGHMAGIYARVDANRGVHKAPANEEVLGALGLKYQISKSQQDGLNPQGVNCIRDLNGNIRVWGARTIGGDKNGEWKYINVRRLFLFLRESIDEGTQWAVFEPNDHNLWAKLRRNINAFLTNVWRSGALFGTTPLEAFYVKCDEETNPPEVRDEGKCVTEIGVSVVKPAEYVVFYISQWAGPSSG